MEMNRQTANALDGKMDAHHVERTAASRLSCDQGMSMSAKHHSHSISTRGQGMFGETPKRKVLCPCGAIAEVDSAMVSTKNGLGKIVECRCCRNRRIAHEFDEMDRHFNFVDDKGDDGW